MTGYYGTSTQQRLQAQAEANVDFIAATPGACQTGRMMGCDDLDRFGWERIDHFLERDGVVGFRLIPAERISEIRAWLAERDCRLDTWDVFLGDRQDVLTASEAILAGGPPNGTFDLQAPTAPNDDYTADIQTLMGASGVVPFSGTLLVGEAGRARTAAAGDGYGAVVAASHAYLPHNAQSPYRHYAWGGLVAVAPSHRGKGLGNYINARIASLAFHELGATHFYELVSATNEASRRMVVACGLHHEAGLVCGIATANSADKYTR